MSIDRFDRALREIILEATPDELLEACESAGVDIADLAARGRAAAERALAVDRSNPCPKCILSLRCPQNRCRTLRAWRMLEVPA